MKSKIHDSNFLKCLQRIIPDAITGASIDTEHDQVKSLKSITVRALGIKSIRGIEYFTNLEYLDCQSNYLSYLYLRENKALKYLHCANNYLTELDVRRNKELLALQCSYNRLYDLYVRENKKLITLFCQGNNMGDVDTKHNKRLLYFLNG